MLVIVAGPNGSGKTTLVRSGILADEFPVGILSINADDIARELAGGAAPTDEISLRAAQTADKTLDDQIEAGASVVVETVLSSDKYKDRMLSARQAGFEVVMVYVTVRLAEINQARVKGRTLVGGHDVPSDRVAARRKRSHDNFAWFAREADRAFVFDNSRRSPVLAAHKGPETGWKLNDLKVLPDELAATVLRLSATQG